MGSNFGYGQLDPSRDSNSDHNSLIFHIRQELSRLNIMKVVQVKAVNTSAQTVDVLPMVSQIDGQGNVTPHGKVFGLQYFRLQGGVNALIIDPAVGDIGIAVCSDRDISGVKSTKKQSPPTCFRSYDIADGVYVGGILNGNPKQFIQFTANGLTIQDANGNSIQFTPGGIRIQDANNNVLSMLSGIVELGTDNGTRMQALDSSSSINVVGTLRVDGVPVTVP